MNEAAFAGFEQAVGMIQIFLYGIVFALFCSPLEKRSNRKYISKEMGVAFFIFAAVYLAGFLFNINNSVCTILCISLITLTAKKFSGDGKKAFLQGVLFFCVRMLSTLMMESLYFLSSQYFIKSQEEIENILLSTAISYSVSQAVIFILCCILLYMVWKSLEKQKIQLQIKEMLHLSIFPIVGILFGTVVYRMYFVVKEDVYFMMFEQYPVFLGLIPLMAVLLYIGILFAILSYQDMIKMQEEKKKYFVAEKQIEAMQERIAEVEQFYEAIGRVRHEMRNHITNIKGLAESENYGEMEQYIARMDASLSALDLKVKTGNPVTDVIINDRCKRASALQIDFESDFVYPKDCGYDAFDIGIIVSNLLQNAIEACEAQQNKRYISIKSRCRKRFFFIEVRNSFYGELTLDENTKLPVSIKQDTKSVHGIGLQNVREQALKYMGDMDIKVKHNEFIITVMLQDSKDNKIL